MALKRKIGKEAFDSLSEAIKENYKEKDGEYVLDIEGDEDSGALKRALDRVREENKENKELVSKLTKQIDEIDQNDARKRGDIAVLEKSWQEKLNSRESELSKSIEKARALAKKSIVETAIAPIANKFKAPSLISSVLKNRVDVDFSGEEPTVRVLDNSGKPSAQTLQDLEKEFLENKEYLPIIVGSKATGSASTNTTNTTGGSAISDKVDLSKIRPADLAAYLTAKKEAQN